MKSKQDILAVYFGPDTVTYNNHVFPTGTLACQALNIPREDVERLLALSPPLNALAQGLQAELCPPELLEPAKISAHEIGRIMTNHSPFCNLDADLLHLGIDEMFTTVLLESHDRLHRIVSNSTEADIAMAYALVNYSLEFIRVLEHLGYSLGQYLDTFTVFAECLDALPNRKINGLAEAVAPLFPWLISVHDGKVWMSGSTLINYYLPMKDKNESFTIGRNNIYQTIVSMLRADFFEGLAVGHAPKRCLNCGRWFLTTNGRHTKYCDGIDPNSDKGVSCRSAGNRKRREFREKAEDNPQKALYITRCDSIRSRVDRGKLDEQIGDLAKYKAKNHLNKALQNADYARNQYETDMEIDALIAEAIKELANAGN